MKKTKLSIRAKVSLGMFLCTLLVGGVIGFVGMIQTRSNLLNQSRKHTMGVAKMAAANIDGDVLDEIEAGDEDSDNYSNILSELRKFIQGDEIEYIYTMRERDGVVSFVVDADQDEGASIGEEYESYEQIDRAFEGQVTVDDEITSDEWGSYYSAFAPIYDSHGSQVGIVGVDSSISVIEKKLRTYMKNFILVEVSGVLVSIILAFIISGMLTRNVRVINTKMKELADDEGDLTRQIDIKSYDEVGEIAGNMNVFMQNLRNIMLDLRKSEETLLEMTQKITGSIETSADEINAVTETMD